MDIEIDIETQLRSDIARAGGLLDIPAAAAILGVTPQAVYKRWAAAAERSYAPSRITSIEPIPEPVAFRAPTSPLWTGAQIARLRRADMKRRGDQAARQDPVPAAS